MSRVINPETYRGYQKQVVQNKIEDPEWIWGPRSSVGKCNQQYPMTSPQYVFPIMLGLALEGLSPLPFRTRPRVYPLC
jgi:hypothetical protein